MIPLTEGYKQNITSGRCQLECIIAGGVLVEDETLYYLDGMEDCVDASG